jgi:hypothetical protein
LLTGAVAPFGCGNLPLYGVKPIRLREQVKRNIKRFPKDFMFQLNVKEIDLMVSQFAIPYKAIVTAKTS